MYPCVPNVSMYRWIYVSICIYVSMYLCIYVSAQQNPLEFRKFRKFRNSRRISTRLVVKAAPVRRRRAPRMKTASTNIANETEGERRQQEDPKACKQLLQHTVPGTDVERFGAARSPGRA